MCTLSEHILKIITQTARRQRESHFKHPRSPTKCPHLKWPVMNSSKVMQKARWHSDSLHSLKMQHCEANSSTRQNLHFKAELWTELNYNSSVGGEMNWSLSNTILLYKLRSGPHKDRYTEVNTFLPQLETVDQMRSMFHMKWLKCFFGFFF